MRTLLALLVIAGATFLPIDSAGAAVPADQAASSNMAAVWLMSQVTPDGYILDPYTPGQADLSTTAQAVLGLASAGVGQDKADAMLQYLADNVESYVHTGASDSPGALAYLILDSVALGKNPRTLGGTDLVARLEATQRPDGLFGLSDQDPTYDGAYRQSLSLLALHAVGIDGTEGLAWLEGQQCADGSFNAYRADTSVPCPPVDAATFQGSDSNSTAMAAVALHVMGADATSAMTWLTSIRTNEGGFPYLGDPTQPLDANSTGLVLLALRTVDGTADAQGAAALAALQVPCSGSLLDRGAIAFQKIEGDLVPNTRATAQSLFGLGGGAFPLKNVTWTVPAPDVCLEPPTTTTPTTAPVTTIPAGVVPSTSVAPIAERATTATAPANSAGINELPATGGGILGIGDAAAALTALAMFLAGSVIVGSTRRAGARKS